MIEDEKIIEMFFERSEQGIRELDIKYGTVCHKLSYHIVGSRQNAEECVNDAYLGVWNTIPPARPVSAIYFHPRSACGEMFRRIHWNNRGCKSIVWRCISRLEPTGQECHARTVNETVLENVVVQAINTLLGDTSTYQAQLQQNIAKVIRSAQQKTADGIDERLQELQKELLKKANNKEAYDEIADEIFKLREQ